jgi:hypothetical protein
MTRRLTFLWAFSLALLGFGTAFAQSSNQPYRFGSVGMSYAARQAILNAKILNVRPRALVRGPDNTLVTIVRRNHTALVQIDGGEFVPGTRPHAGWGTGLGTGLGWGIVRYAGGGYAPSWESSATINTWISLISADAIPGNYGGGGTPIDIWIFQLGQS